MSKKRKLLEKFLKFVKRKKFPKQLSIILIVIILFAIYLEEYTQKSFKKVCFRRKRLIIGISLVLAISFVSIAYSFYDNRIDNKVLAGTVPKADSVSTVGELIDYPGQTVQAANTSIIGLNPYYIKVNRQQNTVTVYTYDNAGNYTVPIKAMVCSTGGKETPLGVFKLSEKYEFKALLYNVYGQYASRIKGQILFHSLSYTTDEKDKLISEEFNSLGESVSHGCIRLMVKDAKWIFDNCASATVVEIYDDDNPGPLGKPDSIKIPEDSKWDPTDPDPDNPWNSKNPSFTGVKDRIIEQGTYVNVLQGITAYDTCGNDITSQIKVNGNVDSAELGQYTVSYSITDLLGREAITTANFRVKSENQ